MKNYITRLVLIQVLLLSCLYGQDWKFKTGEEDWGETYYASQTNSDKATITIFTEKKTFKPAILISPYKSSYGKSFTVDITVDKGKSYRFKGSNSDYFGEIEVEGASKLLLQEIKLGKVVSITLANKDTLSFTLSGASKAIAQLDGSKPKTEDAPQKNSAKIEKPTQLKLNSDKADQSTVTLRWAGATPSMDMSNTNSGEGWAKGHKEKPGVYSFSQSKFYSLTLDFNKGTFIVGGFDGDWLPEVTGTFTPIK